MERRLIPPFIYKKKHLLPNLYVPGAGKSGTSSLHELLNQHPDIKMSRKKEPHFWTSPDFNQFTEENLDEYLSFFDTLPSRYSGESSTGYMAFPNFLKRTKKIYRESPKFIFLLRNPIDRAYSQYWWLRGMGSETKSFREALIADRDIEPTEFHKLPEANYKSYFQFGLYGKWIAKFHKTFGRKNVFIITTESLHKNRLQTLNKCFDFLNLSPLNDLPEIKSNKTVLLRFPKLFKYSKKFVWGDFVIKRVAKHFVPKLVRNYINKNLYNLVYRFTKTSRSYPKMNQSDRKWLQNMYADDVNDLKEISEKTFVEWSDFNS